MHPDSTHQAELAASRRECLQKQQEAQALQDAARVVERTMMQLQQQLVEVHEVRPRWCLCVWACVRTRVHERVLACACVLCVHACMHVCVCGAMASCSDTFPSSHVTVAQCLRTCSAFQLFHTLQAGTAKDLLLSLSSSVYLNQGWVIRDTSYRTILVYFTYLTVSLKSYRIIRF